MTIILSKQLASIFVDSSWQQSAVATFFSVAYYCHCHCCCRVYSFQLRMEWHRQDKKKKEKENNKWVQIVIANQFPVSHTRNAIQFSIHFHATIIVAVDTQLYAPYVIDWVKIMMELNECSSDYRRSIVSSPPSLMCRNVVQRVHFRSLNSRISWNIHAIAGVTNTTTTTNYYLNTELCGSSVRIDERGWWLQSKPNNKAIIDQRPDTIRNSVPNASAKQWTIPNQIESCRKFYDNKSAHNLLLTRSVHKFKCLHLTSRHRRHCHLLFETFFFCFCLSPIRIVARLMWINLFRCLLLKICKRRAHTHNSCSMTWLLQRLSQHIESYYPTAAIKFIFFLFVVGGLCTVLILFRAYCITHFFLCEISYKNSPFTVCGYCLIVKKGFFASANWWTKDDNAFTWNWIEKMYVFFSGKNICDDRKEKRRKLCWMHW